MNCRIVGRRASDFLFDRGQILIPADAEPQRHTVRRGFITHLETMDLPLLLAYPVRYATRAGKSSVYGPAQKLTAFPG
ncbi:hypothetical protein D3C87_1339490 [compost metagenome]